MSLLEDSERQSRLRSRDSALGKPAKYNPYLSMLIRSMLIRHAHCKINLVLDVTARRADGWHDIDSLLVPIDWHDLVGVALRPSNTAALSLRVAGAVAADVPLGESNLAQRAGALLMELAGQPLRIELWIAKEVPAAAGLGGGSADAAAVLRSGAEQLESLGVVIDRKVLISRAMAIGSDVPALLAGGAQRATGLGETLRPVSIAPLHLAVAVAGPSSTAASYAALDPIAISPPGRVDKLISALGSGDLDDRDLGSALEPAACRASPALAAAIHRLRALTPDRRWHLTGSGGALFCLAKDRADAVTLTDRARAHGFPARACRTLAR